MENSLSRNYISLVFLWKHFHLMLMKYKLWENKIFNRRVLEKYFFADCKILMQINLQSLKTTASPDPEMGQVHPVQCRVPEAGWVTMRVNQICCLLAMKSRKVGFVFGFFLTMSRDLDSASTLCMFPTSNNMVWGFCPI